MLPLCSAILPPPQMGDGGRPDIRGGITRGMGGQEGATWELAAANTPDYSMQEGTLSSSSTDELMKHGQASREVT